MTIGIPGGHFFFHLSIPSPSFPAWPGISFKKVQNLSKREKLSFRKRKITRRILFKVYMILKFVADKV